MGLEAVRLTGYLGHLVVKAEVVHSVSYSTVVTLCNITVAPRLRQAGLEDYISRQTQTAGQCAAINE